MLELSRINLYSYMDNEALINEELLLETFRINVFFLKGIEEMFYVDEDKEYSISNTEEISSQLNEKLSSLNNFSGNSEISLLSSQIKGLIKKYNIKKTTKSHYYFNSILKILIKWSDNQILKNKLLKQVKENISSLSVKEHSMVFLSYAFEDHLYTIGLFYYFYSKGIYLYIDWLHNDEISDGAILKDLLYSEMNKCKQLLFLQSINMELNLSGNLSIKPWCAWEIGSFYRKNTGEDKFYISLYKHPVNSKKNIILDGINPMKCIKNGYIQ